MHKGFIKTWRKTLESDLWKMPPVYFRVFTWLLIKANYKTSLFPTRKRIGIWVLPGQMVTSLQTIAEGVAWQDYGKPKVPNRKTIKVVIDWFECNEIINVISNSHGTFISVENWSLYQSGPDTESNTERTAVRTVNGTTGRTHIKNVKEDFKEQLKNKNLKTTGGSNGRFGNYEADQKRFPADVG